MIKELDLITTLDFSLLWVSSNCRGPMQLNVFVSCCKLRLTEVYRYKIYPVIGLMRLLSPEPLLSILERVCSRTHFELSCLVYMRYLALEFVTGGLARATSHRVLSPRGTTPRYSVPFFQNIGLEIRLAEQIIKCECPY